MKTKDPRLTQLTIIIMLVGAFTLRALGINSLTEYIIVAIAVSHLGLNMRRPRD